MYPVIYLFGCAVQSYYLCAAAAGLVGILWAAISLRRELPIRQAVLLPMLLSLLALIGARVLNRLTNPYAYGADFPIWTLSYTKLSLMGGLVTGVFAVVGYSLLSGRSLSRLLDALSVPAATGIVLLKLGCFLNGCCFGKPTDGPFGMVFPANAAKYRFLDSLPLLHASSPCVHPTQLYELFGAALSAALAVGLEKKLHLRSGSRFCLFAAFFALTRWSILPLRALPYPEPVIQILYPCLYGAILIVCILGLFLCNRKRKPARSTTRT